MVTFGIFLPFFGTALGAAAVFFMHKNLHPRAQKLFVGFAAGVMCAASVWSLLLPAIELAREPKWAAASLGFLGGVVFLAAAEALTRIIETKKARQGQGMLENTLLFVAVTVHNLPEGLAVGVAFAQALSCAGKSALASALALAVGIAIQNFPEGAIISMPLAAAGVRRKKAFAYGVLSGAVEPVGAGLTLLFARTVARALPFLLSFAAGAMIGVCVQELIPQASGEEGTNRGALGFYAGFLLMMVLDIAFG